MTMITGNWYFNFMIVIIIGLGSNKPVHGGLNDYIKDIGKYFGYSNKEDVAVEFNVNIPYEVSAPDEKFISEAAKLTGVALSELDSCQQRVILKLKTDCHKLNDEQLAKLAVHLLNCQSYIEGRRTYPCTEEMAIKDCTTNMDSDTWTIYHLMSNRARAVCYMIRQTQFRGLAESTVNRLMDAARHQILTLDKISVNQENLHDMAHQTFDTLTKGHNVLSEQQKDIQKAQFHGQLVIEENIGRLVQEKRLITETHNKLLALTKDLQVKLENSNNQLQVQSDETKLNHQELIGDLIALQEQTHEIFKKIEESSQLLLLQNQEFKSQYEYTLNNLMEVNRTVHSLVSLIDGTKKALEDRLEWISSALGGTDLAVERLYLILWHVAFLLFGMLGCAFLEAYSSTRIIITLVPSLNLAGGLYDQKQHLDLIHLVATVASLIVVQKIMKWIVDYKKSRPHAVMFVKNKEISVNGSPLKMDDSVQEDDYQISSNTNATSSDTYSHFTKKDYEKKTSYEYNEFGSPTPPLSRNEFYKPRSRSRTPNVLSGKESCHGITRMGTPCKLNCLPGRDFCFRHQAGDSLASKLS